MFVLQFSSDDRYDQVTGSQATNWFAARLDQEDLCKVSFDGLLMAISDLYFTLGTTIFTFSSCLTL
jgi:hypothetical protein